MTACRISHMLPTRKKKSGSRRSRVMRNLHTKRRRHSSRGRGKKQSRRRRSSRGRGRKHSRKHKRKHYVHHHKKLINLGSAPILNGMVLRDIVLGNIHPSQEVIDHIPETKRLHDLLKKLTRKSKHGFKLSKRQEIFKKLLPKATHTDEQTHSHQRKAMASIVKDLEAMGLKTPSPEAKLGEREQHKLYNVQTDEMMGLGGINL